MELRGATPSGAEAGAPGSASWRVRPALVWLKVGGAALFVVAAFVLAGDDPTKLFAALIGAILAGGYALRDVVAPVRLAADADGVTVVSGFAGRRRLAWAQIERVRVDERARLGGLKSRMLEIDTGESIHLFSEYDLGVPVEDAAEALNAFVAANDPLIME